MPSLFPAEYKIHSVIDNLDDFGMPDGDPEINISTLDGSLRVDGDCLRLCYREVGEGGEVDCNITVYEDGRVALCRRGAIVSDILFAEGEICNTVYSIPPYRFDMAVETKRIRNSLTSSGGELQLIYSMTVGGGRKNVRMKITVKIR